MPTFDVILITDTPYRQKWIRGYGAHRLASHLRTQGISCLVIDFSSYLNFNTWKSICDRAIGANTKFIGFSTTWWPYRTPKGDLFFDLATAGSGEDSVTQQDTLIYAAGHGKLTDWISYAKKLNSKIITGKNIIIKIANARVDFLIK
jgi:protoporphyrinogen oxidase